MDEFWMLDLFELLDINEKQVLLDFGANVGQSLLKWKAAFPNNPYYGIELLPSCINYLNLLVSENGFEECYIIDKLISSGEKQQELFIHFNDPTDRTASLRRSDLFKVRKSIMVESIPFEELSVQYKIARDQIGIIKIDIEGAELELLYHLEDLLREQRPLIIVEILPDYHTESELAEFLEFLNELEYDMYRILKRKLRLQSLKKIDSIDMQTSVQESDYLLVPRGGLTGYFNQAPTVDP